MLQGGHVLVIEDEFIIAIEIEQTFREAGVAEVTVTGSLDHADLAPASLYRYCLAVMETRIHGVSTLPLARALVAAGVPVVFGTAFDEWRDGVPDLPGVPVVTKPFAPEELFAAVEIASGLRRQPQIVD